MSNDTQLYEQLDIMEREMPIIFHKDRLSCVDGIDHFHCHWHDKIELLYVIEGEMVVRCNNEYYTAKGGDLIVVNSDELHQGFCKVGSVEYYCIIFDTMLLHSRRTYACEAKFIDPITQNRILFCNMVENDLQIGNYIRRFVSEYENREIGYEIAIKATIYELILNLLRYHVKQILIPIEYDSRVKNLKRFNRVLEYIENHYNEEITIDYLSAMEGISRFYFCRLFKSMTGSSLNEYLNILRINKAEAILKSGRMNVTETALSCGFNDSNYFSRKFRKYKNLSPSSVAKGQQNEIIGGG